ncbi:putative ribosome biogenesis GTPase RsgA [Oxalobacteraceae bacterium GrIS 1.18]
MNSAKELRRLIESCELQHPMFKEQFEFLSQRIEDALGGFSSRIEWVVGPSRVGKSMLINALSRKYPETGVFQASCRLKVNFYAASFSS